MTNFTNSDFQKLTENEKHLSELLHSTDKKEETVMPSETSVTNILAYSKALSVRKTEQLGFVEHVLN